MFWTGFSFSFLLHTYLTTLFPDQEKGIEGEEACIAQRGADSFLLSFGVVGRAIFDVQPTRFRCARCLVHRHEEDDLIF